jgi:uncharacterized SAM-binding protein YcdF (DUF218 family)
MVGFAFLVEPLFLFFLLATFGWLVGRRFRRLGGGVIGAAVVALYALSTPLVGGRLLHMLEAGVPTAAPPGAAAPQAVVVLSAALRRSARPGIAATVGPLTLERIRRAAQLHRATGLPILVSGGRLDRNAPAIAATMRDALLEDFGTPVRWVEDASRNTYENAAFSAAILHAEGIRAAYLVTHAWHMPRAREAFTNAGLSVVPAAVAFTYVGPGMAPRDLIPQARALVSSTYAVHELVGRLWYAIVYH